MECLFRTVVPDTVALSVPGELRKQSAVASDFFRLRELICRTATHVRFYRDLPSFALTTRFIGSSVRSQTVDSQAGVAVT
jgi:hypothetical protein